MRFTDFLRATVVLCAGSASLLAAVTVVSVANGGDDAVLLFGAAWWVLAVLIGIWVGRRAEASPPIASLLAAARSLTSLPQVNPARTLVNRLWPLLVGTLASGAVAFALPQVPAVAAGFAIIWALAWRRQSSAVAAIEGRDGARFYIERTSPLKPIRLVRTPGFRSNLFDLNGAAGRAPGVRPRV
jgi:hypothetical protein